MVVPKKAKIFLPRNKSERVAVKDTVQYNEVKMAKFKPATALIPKKGNVIIEIEDMIVDQNEVIEDPYDQIKIATNNEDEDIQCDICLEFEYEDDDHIILCDFCNTGTHQKCYGSELLKGIPSGDWFC